ncbi:hypothetical protein A3H80_01185 [Candidatus Roizmanbacteria bacterium RIFCSPLOWO2_02_FULL_37_19]|nr:MAG: hypothetical protein A3H80_01185 [Candidatus Roizmanbacteria bacterium RIFCSPLOWO2_02_FULL_37_19]
MYMNNEYRIIYVIRVVMYWNFETRAAILAGGVHAWRARHTAVRRPCFMVSVTAGRCQTWLQGWCARGTGPWVPAGRLGPGSLLAPSESAARLVAVGSRACWWDP